MSNQTTLDTLLAQNRNFLPSFGKGFTNHLSMALVALKACQASDQQLQRFYNHYVPNLLPSHPLPQSHLAQGSAYLEYRHYYHDQLSLFGRESVLREHITRLLPGIAGAGFHALIRLSYAIRSQADAEIACALAYWSSVYQPLGTLYFQTQWSPTQQLLKATTETRALNIDADNLSQAIAQTIDCERYAPFNTVPLSLRYDQVAAITLSAYAQTDNFALLHGLTGFEALLNLTPYLDDPDTALHYFWQAYVALFCSAKPKLTDFSVPDELAKSPWSNLLARATHSLNDHHIKLVFSCAQLSSKYPSLPYQFIAEQKLHKEQL